MILECIILIQISMVVNGREWSILYFSLKIFRTTHIEKASRTGTELDLIMYHDNACLHVVTSVQQYFSKCGITIVPYPV